MKKQDSGILKKKGERAEPFSQEAFLFFFYIKLDPTD